jgi:hypothetical protein
VNEAPRDWVIGGVGHWCIGCTDVKFGWHDHRIDQEDMRKGIGSLSRQSGQHIAAHAVAAPDQGRSGETIDERQQRVGGDGPVGQRRGLGAAAVA